MPIRAVLAATDLGPHSLGAMEHAVELARTFPVKVHLVHVKPAILSAEGLEPYLTTARLSRDDMPSADGELRLLEQRIGDLGVICEAHLQIGRPAVEILALAERLGADLIVMGTRTGGGLQRLLFGSVSQRVCRSARCPVTVVRGGLRSAGSCWEPRHDLLLERSLRK